VRLPLSIDNVPYYKIAGQYCFQGDLIFTAGCIYFFPHTDLDRRREQVSEELDAPGLRLLEELVLKPFVLPVLHALAVRGLNHSRLHGAGVWRAVDSSETLKLKLDALSAELQKRERGPDALPLPSRFRREEVSNLKLSAAGALSFDAQSDRHDFGVGIFKKGLLREALAASGFMNSAQRF
jgi:hypothetical protein